MLKIAIINIHSEKYREHQEIGATNITYLAAYLRHYLDIEMDIRIDVVTQRLLKDFKPDLIGLSSTTENYNLAIRDIRQIRREWPTIPIFIGGPHISALPQSLPETNQIIGVIGEGEETFLDLVKLFVKYNELPFEQLLNIPGLAFYNEEFKLQYTPPRKLAEDLDTIPLPERQLLQSIPEHRHSSLLTSRGCPFRCTFCSTRMLWKEIRFHSPQRVLQELLEIKALYPTHTSVRIDDDLFTLNIKRLRQLSNLIREEGLHKHMEFTVSARANTFNQEVCELLKTMNVTSIFFGLETGAQNVLKKLKGPVIQVNHNQRALELAKKYGFWSTGSFIIGSPDETLLDIYQTYWFIRKNYHTMGKINVAYSAPFPDTPLFAQAEKAGHISKDFKDWQVLNFYFDPEKSVYMNEFYSKEEFSQMYDQFKNIIVEKWKGIPSQAPQISIYNQYRRSIYQKLSHFIQSQSIRHVLELGAIHSSLKEFLPQSGYSIISKVPDKTWLPKITKKFDLIFIHHTLEWMTNPITFLKDLQQHLSPGGHIFCLTYNAHHMSFLMELLLGRWQPVEFGIYQFKHLKMYTLKSLKALFHNAGYQLHSFKSQGKPIELNKMPPSIQQAMDVLKNYITSEKKQELETFSYFFQLQPRSHILTQTLVS